MKIAILDADEFYRNYLRMILPLLDGVGEVVDLSYVEDMVGRIKSEKPDVLIFDPCAGPQVDLTVFANVRLELPDCHLIAYLPQDQEQHGETLYRMGVTNVLSKSSGTEYLRYILRQLLAQFQATRPRDRLSRLKLEGQSLDLVHRGIRPLKGAQLDSEPRKGATGSSSLPGLGDASASSTASLEPGPEESRSLKGLRLKLLRKKEGGEKDDASKAANSFQKIWAERKKSGTTSGNSKVNLFKP
jgi:DNA-binding NarL/FixJ family response regulator